MAAPSEWLAGYFLVRSKAFFYDHAQLVTVSDCLHDVVPDGFAVLGWNHDQPDTPPALRAWLKAAYDAKRFDVPSTFLSLESARAYASALADPALRLLGVVVNGEERALLADEPSLQQPDPNVKDALVRLLTRGVAPEPGAVLGYEVLGAELGGGFHSAWCHGDLRSGWLGFTPKLTETGLFADRAEADRAAASLDSGEIPGEPCPWVAAAIRSYSLTQAGGRGEP